MSFFQLLLMGVTYGAITYGSIKIIMAARKALKETQASNRRFIESLKVASRNNLKSIQQFSSQLDKQQNHVYTFEIDNHLFKITQAYDDSSLTCIGFHREHFQQVFSFTHHYATKQTKKHISSQIIHDEEKDIECIKHFIQLVIATNWKDVYKSINTGEKKDYTLVNGSINNADNHVTFEDLRNANDLYPYLANIKGKVKDLPSVPLQNMYREVLLNLEHLLNSEIELDSEKHHTLERIVKKELISIQHHYLQLSSQNQQEQESTVYKSLEIVNKYILLLLTENEKTHIASLEIQLRLNEENYKK